MGGIQNRPYRHAVWYGEKMGISYLIHNNYGSTRSISSLNTLEPIPFLVSDSCQYHSEYEVSL